MSEQQKAPEHSTKDTLFALGKVTIVAAGILGLPAAALVSGIKNYYDGKFPDLNPNKPAEIYKKEFHKSSGGGISLLPGSGGAPLIAVSRSSSNGHHYFEIRQKVKNSDGDIAYAQEPVVATAAEAKQYDVGDYVIPDQLDDIDRIKARPTEHVRLSVNKNTQDK